MATIAELCTQAEAKVTALVAAKAAIESQLATVNQSLTAANADVSRAKATLEKIIGL